MWVWAKAALIARDLLLRKKVKDIVAACPPSMLPQWRDELEARFGLTFEVLDKDYITRVRRECGYGVNPWGVFWATRATPAGSIS